MAAPSPYPIWVSNTAAFETCLSTSQREEREQCTAIAQEAVRVGSSLTTAIDDVHFERCFNQMNVTRRSPWYMWSGERVTQCG